MGTTRVRVAMDRRVRDAVNPGSDGRNIRYTTAGTARWLWIKRTVPTVLALVLAFESAEAQLVGARADAESLHLATTTAGTLDHRAIENYITIEGKAEKRVEPTALRVVLAIMVEKPTSSECETACREMEGKLVKAVEELKIKHDAIVVDFISILPVYEWKIEDRQGRSVAVETRTGFRMQSNVHVEVPTEEKAREVLQTAFELGVSDVIAFDYWNGEIDVHKKEARKEALAAAKEKAALLLGALFDQPPRPLNVHESTQVVYPRSLYESFQNVYGEGFSSWGRNERLPEVSAAKPKNTYYRGFQENTDVQGKGLPLRPQISIVSTVRLYYATPDAKAD